MNGNSYRGIPTIVGRQNHKQKKSTKLKLLAGPARREGVCAIGGMHPTERELEKSKSREIQGSDSHTRLGFSSERQEEILEGLEQRHVI